MKNLDLTYKLFDLKIKSKAPDQIYFMSQSWMIDWVMARGHYLKRSHAFWFFLVFSFLQLAVITNSSQRCISSSFSPFLFSATKINYYSNSVASFQMMRLTRSGDISENPGPKNSLRCFLQNVRSLKAAVADGDSFEYKSAILRDNLLLLLILLLRDL